MAKKVFSFLFSFLLAGTGLAAAGTLTLRNYSEVLVENLRIGTDTSMIQAVDLPLIILNQDDQANTVQIEILKPAPDKVKPGFAPIPDTSWIVIEPATVTISAQGSYETDVWIKIPDDPKYLGQKYQADIRVRVLPKETGMQIALAVQGRLLFTTAAGKELTAEMPQQAVSMHFRLSPVRVELKNVPLGKKVQVKGDDGKPVMLENQDAEKMRFYLQSLNPKDTVLTMTPGYEATPNPGWLNVEDDEITVNGKSQKPVKLSIRIPDEAQYRDKKYLFVVSVKTGAATSGIRYLQILADTAGKK